MIKLVVIIDNYIVKFKNTIITYHKAKIKYI